jgi:hypothetical protein
VRFYFIHWKIRYLCRYSGTVQVQYSSYSFHCFTGTIFYSVPNEKNLELWAWTLDGVRLFHKTEDLKKMNLNDRINTPSKAMDCATGIDKKVGSFDSQDSSQYNYTREERLQLTNLTRGLRRMKRQLLLMYVMDDPHRPAENCHDMLAQVAPENDPRSLPVTHPSRQTRVGSFDLKSPRSSTSSSGE